MNRQLRYFVLLLTLSFSSGSGHLASQTAARVQKQPARIPVSPEMVPYLHARTVIDFSQRELVEMMPELHGLEFAPNQDALARILQKTGETVEAFFRDFPNTTAVEDVYQERIEPGGRVDEYNKHKYRYVISETAGEGVLGLDEYRTNIKDDRLNPGMNKAELEGSYLLTSGHATTSMYFHPMQTSGCFFRYLGREKKGRSAHAVAFAQNPEVTQTVGFINILGTEATVLKQGVAWIDPDSYQIVNMRTDLLARRTDIGLEQHTVWTEFNEFRLGDSSRSYWLPHEVRVTVKCRGWRFQNRHRYSQYKLFSVDSRDGEKKLIPR